MEQGKKVNTYRVIMLILITATITFMITSIWMYNYLVRVDITADTENISRKLQKTRECIEEYYIGEIDNEKMTESAIKGYVQGLEDAYTEYLSKDEYEELLTSVTGDYVGIGIYMYQDNDGNIIVLMPMEGSPAEEADLQTNDIIISINGEDCTNMDISIASSKIKGEEGTTVELEVLRGNETIKKTVERRTVEIKDSRSEILEGNVGYIELSTFDEGCSDNISRYLSEFQDKGIEKVIINLRNNTGGIVTEAIDFAELFLEKGQVIMRSYNKAEQETVISDNTANHIDMDIVIIVNEYSASATEIVTAALKDNNIATVVGTKTYGKGVMQEIIPHFDGALKITIEEFKTPNGDKINNVGITPDVIVEDDITTEEDEQLKAALELLK